MPSRIGFIFSFSVYLLVFTILPGSSSGVSSEPLSYEETKLGTVTFAAFCVGTSTFFAPQHLSIQPISKAQLKKTLSSVNIYTSHTQPLS
jgi:hypothetical protein